jgi:hypothetical protein
MKEILLPLTTKERENEVSIRANLDKNTNIEWCLALCLLKEGLLSHVVITDRKETTKLKISVSPSKTLAVGEVRWHDKYIDLIISRTELDAWLHFFLMYYRDGIGDVDHIDVDVTSNQGGSKNLFLVLMIPEARPPVSEAEVRRRLGM